MSEKTTNRYVKYYKFGVTAVGTFTASVNCMNGYRLHQQLKKYNTDRDVNRDAFILGSTSLVKGAIYGCFWPITVPIFIYGYVNNDDTCHYLPMYSSDEYRALYKITAIHAIINNHRAFYNIVSLIDYIDKISKFSKKNDKP
jgi:hypothetical protein